MKTCRDCGIKKPLSDFYTQRRCKQGVRPECKVCSLAKQSESYRLNPQRRNDYLVRYRAENVEKSRGWQRAYYHRHRDEIRRKAKQWERNWRLANPLRRRANEAKRRAVKLATATGKVDYTMIIRKNGMRCHICKEQIEIDVLEFDHVIPLSKGGAHIQSNIMPAHQNCNRRKYNHVL